MALFSYRLTVDEPALRHLLPNSLETLPNDQVGCSFLILFLSTSQKNMYADLRRLGGGEGERDGPESEKEREELGPELESELLYSESLSLELYLFGIFALPELSL